MTASGSGTAPPNGTYSLTVSALGTDRQGNPVTPMQLSFGSIDTPQSNYAFSIMGSKGDPQVGGTAFSATDGQFVSAGGGAGPGDTLIVFGKQAQGAPAGYDDLESAVKVASVLSNTNLTVVTAFNLNDTTGVSVPSGPVLPYVIGRATIGNISTPATTNSLGVASTTLNYPVSALGEVAAIWVQGTALDIFTSGTKVVTDATLSRFPGVAPATITVNPSTVTANSSTNVQVCISDAESTPLPGVKFEFAFSGLLTGSGTVDGGGSGTTARATDATGCVTAFVQTIGLDSTSTNAMLTFSVGGATATVTITPPPATTPFDLTAQFTFGGATPTVTGTFSITSTPAGITCSTTYGVGVSCTPVSFASGTVVTLTANISVRRYACKPGPAIAAPAKAPIRQSLDN